MSMNFGVGYNPLLNPNLNPQQRVRQYEQQMQLQNQMQPPMQMNVNLQSQQLIKPFYVTSKQEAEASQTPFDGSVHIYVNTAKNEIYTKKLQNDGSAEFKIFKAENLVKEEIKKNDVDLKPILSRLDEQDKKIEEINSEIERMNKYPINKNRKEVKNDE